MSLKLEDTKDLLMQVDRMIKAGRMNFTLLSTDSYNHIKQNELFIDYGRDENGIPIGPLNNNFPKDGTPIRGTIKIMGPNGPVDVTTLTGIKLREFIANFLEVSVNRTKDYEPSMWLMLRQNENGDTGYNESTIEQFYRFIQKNKNELTPYVMQTFKDGKRDVLIPYITSDLVFYDVSKIIENENIKNLDDVIKLLYKLSTDIAHTVTANIEALTKKMDQYLTNLNETALRINNTINSLDESLRNVNARLSNINSIVERAKIVSNSAFKSKTIDLKAGEVLVIHTKGGRPDNNDVEIPPIEIPSYGNVDGSSPRKILKLIYIYHKPTYYSITELVNKSSGSSITSAELESFITKHNRQAFYKIGDNKQLVNNYKFTDNKTVVVNLDSIYKDNNSLPDDTSEENDVNTIHTITIKYVNKYKRDFPDDNSNNWLVGTQKLTFFKNDTIMYYHLNIPNGYMLYNMPSTNNRQANTFLQGYQVKYDTTIVVDVAPVNISTDINIIGDESKHIYTRNMLFDDYFSSTEIYDVLYKGKFTERTTKYYSNEYNISYTPNIDITNDNIKGYMSVIDARYGLPIFNRDSTGRRFFTLRIKHEIFDDNRWDANKVGEFWVTYVVKPNITIEMNSFDYDINSLEMLPDSFSNRIININNDFTTTNRGNTFGYKLKSGKTVDDINKKLFTIKETKWYSSAELDRMDTLVKAAIISGNDPSIDIPTKRIIDNVNIVGIRYQYKDWNPIHKRWEDVYEPGNNKRLYIDKGIPTIVEKDIGLAHLNTDFIYRNPNRVHNINDNTSIILVDLLSHKEIHKIVRFIYRDKLDRDIYIAEAKYYVGDGIKTINMTDVNKYLPSNIKIDNSTFSSINIDMSSAPVIDIIVKTASYKVSKPQRIIQFKYHLEGQPNNIIATKSIDVTYRDRIISKDEIPSLLQYPTKREMYIDNNIAGLKRFSNKSNHRFIPSDSVANYDIGSNIVMVPVKTYGSNISIIQIRYTEHNEVAARIPLDAFYELSTQLNRNNLDTILKEPFKYNLRITKTAYFTTNNKQVWTGNFIIPNATKLELTKETSIYDIEGLSANSTRYSGCHNTYNYINKQVPACVIYTYGRDIVGSGVAGFTNNMVRHDYNFNRLIYNWLNRSGIDYITKASWNSNGLMYYNMNELPIRKIFNDGSNNRSSYPDKIVNNIPVIVEFDILTRNKENQKSFYKQFILGTARYISNPINTFSNISSIMPKYLETPMGHINMGDYFLCDYPAIMSPEINKFSTVNLQFKNQSEDRFIANSKEFINNIKFINKSGNLINGIEPVTIPKIENILGVSRNNTAIMTTSGRNLRSIGLPDQEVSEASSRQVQIYPNNSGYTPVPKPVVPKPIEYTNANVRPEALLSPIILTGEFNAAKIYIEFGPGINAYLPKVATNDHINETNRLKTSDIVVAQYGAKLGSNIISMAEVSQNGIIYIGANYDIRFTLWSAYLDTLVTKVYKNTNNINDIAIFVNMHGDYNTFGLTPYRNTVITRDATISVPRGLKLTENMTLINGNAGKVIEDWNNDIDITNLGLSKDFSIPLRKLAFKNTYIKYEELRNTIVVPTAYWKPGMILTVNLYTNNELHMRYRSAVKNSLTSEEIRTGVARYEFNQKLNIPVGTTVGYIIEAPNYVTSNEVKGVIQII